jgi:hypothetical protein
MVAKTKPKGEPKVEQKEDNTNFDLNNENKYLVTAFKESVYYDDGNPNTKHSNETLKEAFEKYKKIGAETK